MLKIYVINLDRSPQRLDFMRSQFDRLGLAFERIAAVDGAKTDLAPYRDSGLTPGEIGCFLSHRLAWEKIATSGEAYGLVTEDDIRISGGLVELLSDLGWIPAGGNIIKLDTSGRKIGISRSFVSTPGGRTVHGLLTSHTGSAGYLVSRNEASALLERSRRLTEAVDVFLFGGKAAASPERGIRQLVPAVVAQEKRFNKNPGGEMDSLILGERKAKRPSPVRRLARALVRPVRQAGRVFVRLKRRATEDIRYLRVGFR